MDACCMFCLLADFCISCCASLCSISSARTCTTLPPAFFLATKQETCKPCLRPTALRLAQDDVAGMRPRWRPARHSGEVRALAHPGSAHKRIRPRGRIARAADPLHPARRLKRWRKRAAGRIPKRGRVVEQARQVKRGRRRRRQHCRSVIGSA